MKFIKYRLLGENIEKLMPTSSLRRVLLKDPESYLFIFWEDSVWIACYFYDEYNRILETLDQLLEYLNKS